MGYDSKQAPEVIRQRLQRAVAEGELAPELDIAAIAAFYATVIHGSFPWAIDSSTGVGTRMIAMSRNGAG